MPLPTKDEAFILLERHVTDDYQRHHARTAATALEGYSSRCVGDPALRFITGLLHDLDFQDHPETHPQEALRWVVAWDHPAGLIHAVEAHACGYHDYTTLPRTPLATALLATDELCGLFYACRKLNPVPYGQMKASSIKKESKDPTFAAKVDRATILTGCEHLGVSLDDHIAGVAGFLAAFH